MPGPDGVAAADAAETLLQEVSAERLPRKQVRLVLEAAGQPRKVAARVYPDGLTRREAEVLALLARGFATKEIADRLFIAPKTADNHIQNVYRKTDRRSRAAAAMYALEHGLLDA